MYSKSIHTLLYTNRSQISCMCTQTSHSFGDSRKVPAIDFRSNVYVEHCTCIPNVYIHYYIQTSQYSHGYLRNSVILLAIREKCRPVTIVDHLRRRQATALIVDRSKHMLPKRKVPKEGLLCCRVLQCVAVCCSVLQRVAVCCSVLLIRSLSIDPNTCCPSAKCVKKVFCVAVCCSVLQRVAVCCSVLQCVAVCC